MTTIISDEAVNIALNTWLGGVPAWRNNATERLRTEMRAALTAAAPYLASVRVNVDEIVQPLEDIHAPGGLCRWTDVATAIGEVRRALSALEPSAARELALEEGDLQELLERLDAGLEYEGWAETDGAPVELFDVEAAQDLFADAAAAIRALSSPDHADADHAQARDVLARFRDYVIEGITAGTIMRGGEHHNPIWQEVASVLHADADKVEGDGWLPIESAPKDGTYVLACRAHSILPLIIRFDEKYGEWESEQGDHVYNILGWRPLPTTPEAAK